MFGKTVRDIGASEELIRGVIWVCVRKIVVSELLIAGCRAAVVDSLRACKRAAYDATSVDSVSKRYKRTRGEVPIEASSTREDTTLLEVAICRQSKVYLCTVPK